MNEPNPEILQNFDIPESNYKISRTGSGHINDTYLVHDLEKSEDCLILQRINQNVFADPAKVCDNTFTVLDHIKRKLDENPDISYRKIIQTKQKGGINFYCDENNNCWRLISFIPDSKIIENTESSKIAFETGRIIGTFQMLIHELSNDLHTTIPGFHDIHKRSAEFENSLSINFENRKDIAHKEISEAIKWSERVKEYYNNLTQTGITKRCIHNDTKLNNILFNNSDKALCMIDLDTVMPGYIHFDFGDAIRTLANTANEDEQNFHKIKFSTSNFESFSEGYLSISKEFLTIEEINLLAFSPLYMTYIIGLRFLSDYIAGDIYFYTKYKDHNLIRAKNQFIFLQLLEKSYPFLEKTIEKNIFIY
ncbi:phosphotransferase enzyme family protein [Bacteroidota bacterium]